MKITIELELLEKDAKALRAWASVGRMFDMFMRAGENCTDEDLANELFDACETMKQPLDSLHSQVRRQLIEAGIKPAWNPVP